MSVQSWLEEAADSAQWEDDRLSAEIAETEERIVNLRRKREDARFRRAESLAALNVLNNVSFAVERDARGVVTVIVDPDGKP